SYMSKEEVINLTQEEYAEIINALSNSQLDDKLKIVLISICQAYYKILEQLHSAKVTIHKLKLLCGFKADNSKK
ncbi:MAG: hypothetical protein RI982_1364, partial [Bacteroidota bacterium]